MTAGWFFVNLIFMLHSLKTYIANYVWIVLFVVASGSFVYDMDFKVPDWSPSLVNYELIYYELLGIKMS